MLVASSNCNKVDSVAYVLLRAYVTVRYHATCVTIAGRLYHFVGNQNSLNISSGLGYLFFGQPISDSNIDNENKRLDSVILDYIFEVS
jgi:hypothetical protein